MMKPTKRSQPMRVSKKRAQTRALKSAQKGKPAHLQTTHMKRRAAMRKKRRRPRAYKSDPMLSLLAVRRRL